MDKEFIPFAFSVLILNLAFSEVTAVHIWDQAPPPTHVVRCSAHCYPAREDARAGCSHPLKHPCRNPHFPPAHPGRDGDACIRHGSDLYQLVKPHQSSPPITLLLLSLPGRARTSYFPSFSFFIFSTSSRSDQTWPRT